MTEKKNGSVEPAASAAENHLDESQSPATPDGFTDTGRSDPAGTAPKGQAERLMTEGRFAEAADLYTAAVASDSEDVSAILGLGAALRGLGQYEASEREIRRALRMTPGSAEVHYQLGLTLYRRGVYAAATSELRQAGELDPGHAPARLLLGEAFNQMGDADAAIRALEDVTRLQPGNERAYYALGIAYDRKGHPDRAAEMYRRSRELAGR